MLPGAAFPPPPEPKHRTPNPRRRPKHRGVYLWPRRDHWNYKRDKKAGEAKRPRYVRYVGHGGCPKGKIPKGQRVDPACKSKRRQGQRREAEEGTPSQ